MAIAIGQRLERDTATSHESRKRPGTEGSGKRRYLYGQAIDFLCLGGASLFLLPLVLMLPTAEFGPTFVAASLAITHVLNHPHFAVSYQIFYGGFRAKAFGAETPSCLRTRYVLAGIVVPTVLAAFFTFALSSNDARLLGYGANAMAFFVGWHYVKQGYGMLMVDAALKRQFFDITEKRILQINAYAVWALAWLAVNAIISRKALWGIEYYAIDVPRPLLVVGFGIALGTSVVTAVALATKCRRDGGRLPWNGVVAYGVSLYLWLLLMQWNVLWLSVVPALHSLQYLVVVSRYSLNRFKDEADATGPPHQPLIARLSGRQYRLRQAVLFGLAGALGYLAFWGAPDLLNAWVDYDRAALGPTVFLFVVWVFINIHHYFLDNVIWRSQNPDIRKYLFS